MPTYHQTFSSDCSTLEVGCYLKIWNGSTWVNADSYTNVVSGKFSDGSYCYTVSNGVITAKDTCTVNLYMNICTDTQAGSGYVSVRLQSQDTTSYSGGTLVNVNTNVTVGFTIYGESSGLISDTITITSGNNNTGSPISFGPGFGASELVQSVAITSVSPGSSGNQNFNAGSTNIGSC